MEDKTLYVFDFDGTLMSMDPFSNFVDSDNNGIVDTSDKSEEDTSIKGPEYESRKSARKYFIKIKGLFSILFSKEVYFVAQKDGDIVIYDHKSKSPLSKDYLGYIDDINGEKAKSYGIDAQTIRELPRMFKPVGDHIIVEPFSGYHSEPSTIGSTLNEDVYTVYEKVKNKMILTGRKENLRADLEKRLRFLDVQYPNCGLYMYTGNDGISKFKNLSIENSIVKNNWTEVHFFEDKQSWLDSAQLYIGEKFPNIRFIPHLIL